MFATSFINAEDGYKLIVDSSRHQTAEQWLNVQECVFDNYSEEGCSIFVLKNPSDGVIYRLNQRYGSASNDNDEVQAGLQSLREAIAQKSWTMILDVTKDWTAEHKKAVWLKLDKKEKKEINFLFTKYSEMVDFQERLYALDERIVKKMVVLLKEVGLVDKGFKIANKVTKDFIDAIMADFLKNEEFIRASLNLACACVE